MPLNLFSILNTAAQLENLFSKYKFKLLNNPNEASVKLAEVLNELGKIMEFVEWQTVQYLQIIFLKDKSNFVESRSALLSLESGYVTIKGYEARGHCHKIQNIYEKYLSRWFSKVLEANEALEFKYLFENMNVADNDMVEGIKEITQWLKNEAERILNLIDKDKLEEANECIKEARIYVQQARRSIVEALAQLKLLEASFIASAQTV